MPDDILGHKSFSITDYLAMPKVPQPYIVEGLIYEHGKTVVVGKPKFGKSYLAVKIGLSVALGQPILHLRVVQSPVLMLKFDRRHLINVIHEISRGRATDIMHIIPAQGLALNELDGSNLLLASVHKYCPKDGKPLLVIIDHKSACLAGKENDDAPNKEWVANLDRIASWYPVTYLVVSQTPKGFKGELIDLPIGSRVPAFWADTVVAIQKPNKDTRKLDMVSNYQEIEPITYNKNFEITSNDEIEETKFEAAITVIEERLSEFIYPNISQKVVDISQMVGCSYSTAWAAYTEVKRRVKAIDNKQSSNPEPDKDDDKT